MLQPSFLSVPSRWGALLFAVALSACTHKAVRPDGGQGPLPVGAEAPEVVGRDLENREVRLSAQRGRPVVVYFYPMDATPGCTQEACAFRDVWSQFERANVTVIGVSKDSEESHRKFLADKKLPFALAADESGAIGAAYGVDDRLWGYARVTYLIDREGRVAKYWPDVDPGLHAKEVLAAAEGLPK